MFNSLFIISRFSLHTVCRHSMPQTLDFCFSLYFLQLEPFCKCLHGLERYLFQSWPLLQNSPTPSGLWSKGEKKAETQGSSGKFYIKHYKLDSIRMWLFGSKRLSLGVETSTWLSHHSILAVGLSGKSWLGSICFCLPIRRKFPGTQFILGLFQFVFSLFQFTFHF